MLAKRIIPVVLFSGSTIYKGTQFDPWRSIGHVRQSVYIYGTRALDELVLLDIGATPEGREPDFKWVRKLVDTWYEDPRCQPPPLTLGGGIRTLEHFYDALLHGADKVCINTAALERPTLIREASMKHGRQAVVVSIDVSRGLISGRCGKQETGLDPVAWAETVEALGAGEIILNVIERDGMMEGYDLDLIRRVSSAVGIPVVACGGAGCYEDFALALDAGAHAVAASAMFAFTEQTPAGAACYLHSRGYPVRRKIAA